MSQKRSHESSNEAPAHILTTELEYPLSYLDRLLQNGEHNRSVSSSTVDFLMMMLDYLTDYIIEMVAIEACNGGLQIYPQEAERAANNGERHNRMKDTAFTLFDQIPGSRRKG
ncbi:huntingtin-interacting protein M [Pteropus medius]|uniref:huntingtin-interacting protein M-like n=1 Tax=Pteropus vampyrus TaxID=132908 RepID=UPI00196B2D84|nr:huntingtin-interacting protein M-like [Pteropus giganteus]